MRPYLLALLTVVALLLAGGCDLFSKDDAEEDEPQDFAVLIENRSTTPLSSCAQGSQKRAPSPRSCWASMPASVGWCLGCS